MRGVFTVAKYTTKEIYQSKIFVNVFFIGIFMLLFSYVAAELTYGAPQKVSIDFGIGMATFAAVGIAIFFGVNLVSEEVENRTLYMVLSRPISRSSFLLGKIIGMFIILFINTLLLYSLSIIIFFSFGGAFSNLMIWAPIYIFLEAMIILLFVVMLSIIVNKTITVLTSILFVLLGHAISEVMTFAFILARPWLKKILLVYSYIMPDLSKFNIKSFLLHQESLSSKFLLSTTLYGLVYMLMLMAITIAVFRKKNLD